MEKSIIINNAQLSNNQQKIINNNLNTMHDESKERILRQLSLIEIKTRELFNNNQLSDIKLKLKSMNCILL